MKICSTFLYTPKAYSCSMPSEAMFKKSIDSAEENDGSTTNKYEKYDIRNCTFDEFTSTIKALTTEGKLTSHDILLGTADFEKSFKQLNPNFKYYITPADSEGRRNWVDEFGALAERDFRRGNMLGYKRNMERKELAVKASKLLGQ